MEAFLGSSGVTSGATNAGLPSADVERVKVAVIAAGSFGMAMATIAARRGHDVVIYARDEVVVDSINQTHRNPKMFPNHELLPEISATTSVENATADAKIIMMCLPAQRTPDFLSIQGRYSKGRDSRNHVKGSLS
ncbi:hypothetical protein Poli38472_014871 [Pythium oligandrum]|uniref:Glycerol-3-phosphate dehydrogenase NAD-dependent N-terminal domain-containing protein n=1 Tax=Pythium oligandrum TaxID=41045 RepID=A0A8K1C1Y2_PYTOL|nr:hypothetical protein Poli38472_014871 [Pythium oligandrum]|eukprot:TMW54937.1 hypothetical protein Poli38472_014871 [Pythium oligandrum]